jgi:phosphoglucosamine mutase
MRYLIFLQILAIELPYHPAETSPPTGEGNMVRKYFGTDGIRGRANGEITPELALKVGQAAGLIFRRGDHRHRVLIGKDTRSPAT